MTTGEQAKVELEHKAAQLEIDGLQALVGAMRDTKCSTLRQHLEGLIEKSANRLDNKLNSLPRLKKK